MTSRTGTAGTVRGRVLPGWLELGAVAALGAVQTIAFAETTLWLLPLLAIGVLAWRLALGSPKRAAALGFAYTLAWLCAATWWLFISMHRYGGLPAWMAVGAIVALSAFLGAPMALAAALFARWRSAGPARAAALFAALWLLVEMLRGVIFTGFPWAASGYAQVDAPFAALAPWLGVYGLGAVAAGLAAWAALSLASQQEGPALRRFRGVAAAVAVTVLLALLPRFEFTRASGTLTVSLLQGNIPQEEKFAQAHQTAALEWHVRTMLEAQGDLVVAPETAVPFLPQQMPPEFWPALQQHFGRGRTHALFGVPLGDEDAGYTNSAVGFAPSASGVAAEYRYSKHHLVPFGEFIPTGFKWFTRMMNIPLGDFNRGALDQPSFAVRGERIAPNICYEDLFGEELAKRFADASTAPTIFANLSNIGWFGETIAVAQHLHISRMRSLEFERPMLRATNTGATAVIDHRGVVRHWQPPHTRGVLNGSVEGRSGTTPFAGWAARFGLWPLVLIGVAGVWLLRGARVAWGRP